MSATTPAELERAMRSYLSSRCGPNALVMLDAAVTSVSEFGPSHRPAGTFHGRGFEATLRMPDGANRAVVGDRYAGTTFLHTLDGAPIRTEFRGAVCAQIDRLASWAGELDSPEIGYRVVRGRVEFHEVRPA